MMDELWSLLRREPNLPAAVIYGVIFLRIPLTRWLIRRCRGYGRIRHEVRGFQLPFDGEWQVEGKGIRKDYALKQEERVSGVLSALSAAPSIS